MKIIVSACLLGENCKYNGGNNRNEKVLRFLEGHEIIPVCPEVMGGLPTPRTPGEIVGGKVLTKEGASLDDEYRLGAQIALKKALESGAELAILQSRSPSCGAKQIYDGTFSKKLIPGKGVFAKLLEENNITAIDAEEL